jgi:hypothetical protein
VVIKNRGDADNKQKASGIRRWALGTPVKCAPLVFLRKNLTGEADILELSAILKGLNYCTSTAETEKYSTVISSQLNA